MLVAYDMVGNPWSYRGHTLEWSRIRLLTKWDDIEIDYNASGIRTRKGDTYYELDGSTIISETTCGDTIRYYYGNGGIVGFRYNGSRYYYEKNLQSDIVGIYDANGDKVGAYVYDAWGNTTITTNVGGIATINPFRYRGYYYDSDIGLYYLKTRYYDAAIGRFINADEVNYLGASDSISAYNLFTYCDNNPITYTDSSGNIHSSVLNPDLASSGGGAGIGGLLFAILSYIASHVDQGAVSLPQQRSAFMEETLDNDAADENEGSNKKKKDPPTVIYRYGGSNPSNLTPRAKDRYTGLSFTTIPPALGQRAVMTTIEAINATGYYMQTKTDSLM